jgi:hypothetical protein
VARRQVFAPFAGQGRLPGATSRARRNAAKQSVQQTAGAGLRGDRRGRHVLDIAPSSFLYVGPDGLDARIGPDLEVAPGSPRRLGVSAELRGLVAAVKAENVRLAAENASLRARVTAQEAEAVTIAASVGAIDARLQAIEGGLLDGP